jgi:predicted transcriptional regulator
MSIAESSAKHRMIGIIEKQPDDSSYDEILRELAFARMVDRGLADSDAGRTIANEELRRRIKSWQK